MLPTDATRHDLHQLEERVDAQFHDIDARFAAVEARFVVLDDQLDRIGRHHQALASAWEGRCDAIDARLDATRTHVDHVRSQLLSQLDHTRRDVGRMILLGVPASMISTAGLCAATIILLS